jgi:predicted DNA-binding protein with PD1-like motif
MRFARLAENPTTYAIIFATGDELASGLRSFAVEHHLAGSSFKAIGAFSRVRLAWLNWESKQYQTSVALDEQVELVSLIGDVALKDGEPQVHAHVIVARSDGAAFGGHLLEAHVRPTCEVILTESPRHLRKQIDPESGLPMIRP